MLLNLTLYIFLVLTETCTIKIKVKVKQGTILGSTETTVFEERVYYAFYRVPYAIAPVGKLRFQNTKPLRHWAQQLNAKTEYHGACAQEHVVHKHGLYGIEDCLYLNIFTPHLPQRVPVILKAVIVWIHGYAFTSSFSHIHGADFLIENDVVLVTLTHRIGVFGFLKLNESDCNANMGLKDIVEGLKWIRRNIAQFGGDKTRVTVMASGSASTLISLLLVTKHRNLITKLILHSGSIYSPSVFQGDFKEERHRLERELKKRDSKDLNINIASTEEIIQASRKIYSKKEIINFQRPVIPFSPIIEKESSDSLITMSVNEIYKIMRNTSWNIPILIGFTSQESILEVVPFIHNPHYLKSFQTLFKYMVPFWNGYRYKYSTKTYKTISNKIKKQYFKSGISESSVDDFLNFATDLIKYPIYKFIKLRILLGNNIFVYKFNYLGKFNVARAISIAGSKMKIKGAAQGDELCYILKCDPLWESYVRLKQNKTDRDRMLIKQISAMWANFAKYGDPTPFNSFGNLTWPPMSLDSDNVFLFDKQSRLINSKPEQKMFQFWNELYKDYYAPNIHKHVKDEL